MEENAVKKSNQPAANHPPSSASSSNIPSRRSSGDGDYWSTFSSSNKSSQHRPPSGSQSAAATRRPSLTSAVSSNSQFGPREHSASHGNLANTRSLPREMRSDVFSGHLDLYPSNAVSSDDKIISAIENSLQQQKEDLRKYFDEKFSELQKNLDTKMSVLQENWDRLSPLGLRNFPDIIASEVSSYRGSKSASPDADANFSSSNSPNLHQKSISRKSQRGRESVQSSSPTQVSEDINTTATGKVSSGYAVHSPLLKAKSDKVRF